jgi:hypothetical protein
LLAQEKSISASPGEEPSVIALVVLIEAEGEGNELVSRISESEPTAKFVCRKHAETAWELVQIVDVIGGSLRTMGNARPEVARSFVEMAVLLVQVQPPIHFVLVSGFALWDGTAFSRSANLIARKRCLMCCNTIQYQICVKATVPFN